MSARTQTSLIWIVLLLVSLLAGALAIGGRVTAQGLAEPQVEAALQRTLADGGQADFIIEMAGQADLSAAYAIQDWDKRGRYVVDTLKVNAGRSQAGILSALEKRGIKTTSFYAANVIYVHAGDQPALEAALRQPGIARVRLPVSAQLTPFSERLRALGPELQDLDTASISWGLEDTLATSFWSLFGRYGKGIIVANIDTGVDYTHTALASNYRCQSNPADPACWYDPSGTCLLFEPDGEPCDNHGHGTHTIGTMAAENDPSLDYIAGMAPDAQWIACKGCILTDPNGIPITEQCPAYELLACGQWMLAPGGDSANRPHVVNNSWGDVLHDTWYSSTVTAWRAAGIFPVFSAGNAGLTCESIGSPAEYLESFAVAAHDVSRTIASFSSRGPGYYGTFTKPNLSAPGVGIMSTLPGGTFGIKSGTSMSAPHLAGAVALLWSWDPMLRRDIDATIQRLQSTTDLKLNDLCGISPVGGDYIYGYGLLNILAAGDQALAAAKGLVIGKYSHHPIEDAVVYVKNSEEIIFDVTSDAAGYYAMALPPDTYTLWAVKGDYSTEPQEVTINDGQVLEINLQIDEGFIFLPIITN